MSTSESMLPKWAREIIKFHAVKSQFLLWGNTYDVYPYPGDGLLTTLRMDEFLRRLLKEQGYDLIISYEPVYGFTMLEGEEEKFKKIVGSAPKPDAPIPASLGKCAEAIEKAVGADDAHVAVMLNFSSRLQEVSGNDINEFYYKLFRLSQGAIPKLKEGQTNPKFNVVLWMLDKENDLPAWYMLDNPRVKSLSISKPDYQTRKAVIETLSRSIKSFADLPEATRSDLVGNFVDQTGGLHASEIVSILSLARRERIPFTSISDAIRMYKLGILENPWAKLDLKKISKSEDILSQRVKGQPQAIQKASDIIKRSVFNLSGAQYSVNSQRPKGILFFAGPTGVGKTELAKSITEMIFGSDTSCLRFDMSEYSKEHADQRLVGAPPGYVGYDVGGQLTGAIKQNPFSVVLFDEIEKAHPRILDIFLQILDDGRLTSGRGEAAYFSESLIVFTSNLGVFDTSPDGTRAQRVNPSMDFAQIKSAINNSIEDFFVNKISRPEILNRIGDNIVVFDFIRPEIAGSIFDKMMRKVLQKLKESQGIKVMLGKETALKIMQLCCADLAMGGRGIGNRMESVFINPLSRALFEAQASHGDVLMVTGIEPKGQTWDITLQKRSEQA